MQFIFVWSSEGTFVSLIPDSSMVEHTAVNRGVVGSSPTQGVWLLDVKSLILRLFFITMKTLECNAGKQRIPVDRKEANV